MVDPDTIVAYQIFAMPDGNQAESLASYLNRHGFEAVSADNEVTCPSPDPTSAAHMFQMLHHWRLFWRYSEKELYGLTVHAKPGCAEHQ